MTKIQGAVASEGIACATALVLEKRLFVNDRKSIAADKIPSELEALQEAIKKASAEVERMQQKAFEEGSEEQGEIFAGYIEIIEDEELFNDVKKCMEEKLVDLSTALGDVCSEYAADMAALDDPYLQARADDFRQIFSLIEDMHTGNADDTSTTGDFILVSDEVGPADLGKIDKKFLRGIVVENGSRTSHAAIIARSMGAPMLSGINYTKAGIKRGMKLILDTETKTLIVDVDAETEKSFAKKLAADAAEKADTAKYIDKKAITASGIEIMTLANIGTVEEVDDVIANNADGIGLFRTEFLFMQNGGKRLPSEEEQFKSYKAVLEKMSGKPVTFRTLDAGGDKNIDALAIPKEENPFLGWRAIRYCLKNPEILRTQLRALLRASAYGNCRIMIPMISNENEIIQVKKLIDSVLDDFVERGEKAPERVPFGIMVETPAAAVISDVLAKQVDFFSLGTNDLTQYTVAVDRGNEYVSELYDEMHPAVIALIAKTIQSAKDAGIHVCMCGEMAGDTRCTETLLKAGLREFSMSANRIPVMKKFLATLNC